MRAENPVRPGGRRPRCAAEADGRWRAPTRPLAGPPSSERLAALAEGWSALGWSASDLPTRPLRPRADEADPPELPAGPRYAEVRELARGGMGSVVLAHDRFVGRPVALKRLLAGREAAGERARFLQEAQVTGQLEHPNVVAVHDVDVDGEGRHFYTMPYLVGGESLQVVIERLRLGDPEAHRRYSMERRVQVVQQVARALAYAHARGVVHRDVKPANVMVGRFGEVYLLDWGLARVGGASPDPADLPLEGDEVDLVTDPAETDPDVVMGTPLYMAPEQLRGRADARSDVYALAAVLHELLSLRHYLGEPPDELGGIVRAVARRAPARADAERDPLNGRVPGALADLCARGLAKDPGGRVGSAAALAEELQAWLEGRCGVACPNGFALAALQRWKRALVDHPGPATLLSLLAPALLVAAGVALGLALS